jgi:hypothetical protein
MSGNSSYVPKSAFGRWFESRLPIMGLAHSSFVAYPVPRNINYLWTFGAILAFMLAAQIVTGVVLAMHYAPSATLAFASIERIMRDVNYGWLIRYLHTNGASLFFLAVYMHIFRSLYYGFYKAPPDMALLAKSLKYERGFPWFVFDALPFDQYQEMGADYIYAILHGYTKSDDPRWNLYYPGHRIAMPRPIADGAVAYQDGAPPTLDNYAKDVASFLSWAAEPTLAERKKIGLRAMIFLFVFSALLYFTKRRIWSNLH